MGSETILICFFFWTGRGVQNLEKPAFIILERSLSSSWKKTLTIQSDIKCLVSLISAVWLLSLVPMVSLVSSVSSVSPVSLVSFYQFH